MLTTTVLFLTFPFLSLLFDAIEKSLRKTAGESLIPSLYRGTLVNKIICLKCSRKRIKIAFHFYLLIVPSVDESQREEEYQDVPLIVKGFNSITESLAAFTTYETLSGDNQYAEETYFSFLPLLSLSLRKVIFQ
jgi:hypothetical protein